MKSPFASNLAWRIATAVVALPTVLAVLVFGPVGLSLGVVGLTACLGLLEFFRLLEARGLRPMRGPGLVVGVALFLDVAARGWSGAPLWPLGTLLLLSTTLGRSREVAPAVSAAAATLLGSVYLGGLGGTMGALITLDPPALRVGRVCLLFAIIMVADSCAFFVGHAFGRRRLAPSISPGKTVEGAIGGIGGGILGALAVRAACLPSLPLLHAIALGAGVAGLGIVGDLLESLFKRWAGVKDSGRLFPGHGGMLDRLDSLLFGAPALYYYFIYVR